MVSQTNRKRQGSRITNLQIDNFSAFTDLLMDFSSDIKIIDENSTGKTQRPKTILVLNGSKAHG